MRKCSTTLYEKIRLLETNSPPNNDFNEQQNICYEIPVWNSFSTLRNMGNQDILVLTENSSSEGSLT